MEVQCAGCEEIFETDLDPDYNEFFFCDECTKEHEDNLYDDALNGGAESEEG